MTALPPNAGAVPPGVPPQQPQWPGQAPPPRETRGVSFFVAIFLGILLVASGGLNVLLLLVSAIQSCLAGGHVENARPEVHNVSVVRVKSVTCQECKVGEGYVGAR